jgi:hypothetical protein
MNICYQSIGVDELSVGDIILMDFNKDTNIPKYRYIILEVNYPFIVCFNLDINKVEALSKFNECFNSIIYKVDNISHVLSIKALSPKEYCWMGIAYNEIKVLIDLTFEVDIEIFKPDECEWDTIVREDKVHWLDDDLNMLEITLDEVAFRVDFRTLNVYYALPNKNGELEFKRYYNYLLGEDGDFLFNEDGELEFIKGDSYIGEEEEQE